MSTTTFTLQVSCCPWQKNLLGRGLVISQASHLRIPGLQDQLYVQIQVLNRKIDRKQWQSQNEVLSERAQLIKDINNLRAHIWHKYKF